MYNSYKNMKGLIYQTLYSLLSLVQDSYASTQAKKYHLPIPNVKLRIPSQPGRITPTEQQAGWAT